MSYRISPPGCDQYPPSGRAKFLFPPRQIFFEILCPLVARGLWGHSLWYLTLNQHINVKDVFWFSSTFVNFSQIFWKYYFGRSHLQIRLRIYSSKVQHLVNHNVEYKQPSQDYFEVDENCKCYNLCKIASEPEQTKTGL